MPASNTTAASLASQGIQDPYAAIRSLQLSKESRFHSTSTAGEGGDGGGGYSYDAWSPDQATLDAITAAGFESKYNRFTAGEDGTMNVSSRRPASTSTTR